MNKKSFEQKILTQKYFALTLSEYQEPIICQNIKGILDNLGYGSDEDALEDIRQWGWESKIKTFFADIDGPTLTVGDTKAEVLQNIKKVWHNI